MKTFLCRLLGGVVLGATLITLAGCLPPADRVRVLAGSELKDLEPFFDEIRRATGIELEMTYIGTLQGAERLAQTNDFDMAWFSHAKYLSMLPGTKKKILAQEKIMLSPVVLGVKESRAREWGWSDGQTVTWRDIAEKAGDGALRFAMTNPASSNSGFTSLLGVAAAFSGSQSALTTKDVNKELMKTFYRGQKLTSGSSGWLAEAYVREQGKLDGIINYESVLMSMNDSGELKEKLVLVYPREGIVTADYPLMLLKESQRGAFQKLADFLRSPGFQKTVMEETSRRPVIPQVALDDRFSKQMLVELPFPADVATVDELIFAYLDEMSMPSTAIFVLDISGSMRGERLADLKAALRNLTGMDQSLTGKFSRFRDRENVIMIPFNGSIQGEARFPMGQGDQRQQAMNAIRQYVDSLNAGGGTAIYTALRHAYDLAAREQREFPDRYYSVVLLSDGENQSGMPMESFRQFFRGLPPEMQEVKTFAIVFGDADAREMHAVAGLTGGRAFAGQAGSLSEVFKKIRGYQ